MQAFDELWVLGLGNDWAGRAAAQGRAVGARVVVVEEGALPDWADAVPHVGGARRARGGGAAAWNARSGVLPASADVARDMLALYREAGARG